MDFYYIDLSPPCRAVILTANALGIKMNMKVVELLQKEQYEPEFLAINPQHVVPVLVVDKDLIITEGAAIQAYLVNQLNEDNSLYPREPRTRSQVDRFLHFANSTMFSRLSAYARPIIYDLGPASSKALEACKEALGWMNQFLEGHDFIVGNTITIADHNLMAIISSCKDFPGLGLESYPNVDHWYKRCAKAIPDFQKLNQDVADKFSAFVKNKM